MSFQMLTAAIGMNIGLVLMLLGLLPATPRMFLPIGGFLLITGFCKILEIQRPKA